MKRILALLFQIYFVNTCLWAYDYQTVYSHRTALFENEMKRIIGFKVDSAKFDGDSILFPFKNIQDKGNCYTTEGASWLGEKIIVNAHWNYFFNMLNDTIKIKTDAKLNETWTLYKRSDITITATVEKLELQAFLGLSDSVKTIILHVYDLSMSPMPHKLEGRILKLSKNYGQIQSSNFLVFPDCDMRYLYNDNFTLQTLVGLSNPIVGIQNLKWFDVHDFQVGDEMHVLKENSQYYLYPAPYYYIASTLNRNILKYINRENYTDSIVYRIDRNRSIVSLKQDNIVSVTYAHDTIRTVIYKNEAFDKLPASPVPMDYYLFSYFMNSENIISKIEPSMFDNLFKENDSCWTYIPWDGCYPEYKYMKGLGGPYSRCHGMGGEVENTELVYYKKGSDTWGTPFKEKINTDYKPLLTKNNQWNVLHSSSCPDIFIYNQTEVMKLSEDTVILGVMYKKLISAYDSLASKYKTIGCLREDRITNKVYYRPKNKNEFLLYDFDVKPNDTIKIPDFRSDGSFIYNNIVLSVDSIQIATETHKRITLNSRRVDDPVGSEFNNQVWIEGIGGTKGLLTSYYPGMIGGEIMNLLCFSRNDSLIFKNDVYGFDNCFYWQPVNTGINEINGNNELEAYPNPTHSIFSFKSTSLALGCTVEIMNITGMVILRTEVDANHNSVNLSNFGNGLYFYRLKSNGKLLKAGKVLKM